MAITGLITNQERAARKNGVEQYMACVRLEGFEPSEEAKAIAQRYVEGEPTVEEMGAEIRAMNARNSDPYTYPGTDVLRNIPDIRDPEQLAVYEGDSTFARLEELRSSPLKGRHLRAIHKYIFQDVLTWAGEFRTVNISKGGNSFGAAAFVWPATAHGSQL